VVLISTLDSACAYLIGASASLPHRTKQEVVGRDNAAGTVSGTAFHKPAMSGKPKVEAAEPAATRCVKQLTIDGCGAALSFRPLSDYGRRT
jgi:hypothetical protein